MKKFTVGFLYDNEREKIFLIRKGKPTWQIGKLNGVGGKIEEGESPLECWLREVQEETGVLPETLQNIEYVACLQGADFECHVFEAEVKRGYTLPETKEVEPIVAICTHLLHQSEQEMVNNLPWLIKLSLDTHLSRPILAKY